MKTMRSILSVGLASLTVLASANAQSPATSKPATNAPAPTAPAPKDTLEFLNGDLLRGSFMSLDGKGGVRWQHTSIKHVLTVNPVGVYKVRLLQPKSNRITRPNCLVRLANGDELFGDLISLDEQNLVIETWYAGQLTFPRASLYSLTIGLGRFNVIYEGPTGAEGWTIKGVGGVAGLDGRVVIGGIVNAQMAVGGRAQSGWQYKNEAFYGLGNGSLGRDVKLPPMSNIEFDLAWRGYPQISIFFYTDNLEGYGGNAYVMQFSYRNVYLRRQSANGRSSNLGTIEMPNTGRSKTRVAIRTDREKKTIALFMDYNLVKQWTDNADFSETGTGILYYLQGGQQAMKISNIRITEWDGRLDDNQTLAASPKQDLVRLINKDKVSGALKSIKDGKMSFTTAFATLDVPLGRISQVEFAAENIKTNQLATNEVRVFFADRGRLMMQVERWDDQQVVGASGNFGSAKFLPSAFSAIQFNLDKLKVDTDSLDSFTTATMGFQPEMWIDE